MPGLDLEKVFAVTAADVRKSFVILFPLFLTIAVAVNLLNGALLGPMLQPGEQEPSVVFGPLIVAMCVGFLVFGFEVIVGAQLRNGEGLRPGAALGQALRRFPALFLVVLGYYLACAIGTLLLIIPGIIAFVTLGYAWFFALLDDRGPVDALRDSFRLIWGNAWHVAGANLLLIIVYFIAAGIAFNVLPGTFEELIAMLSGPPAYHDWRRWIFDALGAVFGVVYLMLNLNIFGELKRLKNGDAESGTPQTAVVSA